MTRLALKTRVTSSTSRRRALLAASAVAALSWGIQAQALPAGGSVESGTAAVVTSAKAVDVNQSSQRAVVDWSSFNLSPDEIVRFNQAFGANAITFNRIGSATASNIAGTITAPGGVWLFSPAGLIIGPSARINVGSFLASTGDVNSKACGQSCNVSGPSTPTILTDHSISIFGATGSIDVQSGAQINAGDGFVVLNSEKVTQNGAITATDGVAYVLSDSSTVNFTDGNAGGASQQLGTIDVSQGGIAPAYLHHGGSTKGLWVQVSAPAESNSDGGFTGVINLQGIVEATGLAPTGTETTAVLVAGVDDTVSLPISGGNRTFDIDGTGGSIKGDVGGLFLTGSSAKLGTVSVAGGLSASVDGDLTLTGVTKAGGHGFLQADNVHFNANTTIGGDLETYAFKDVAIAANVLVSAGGYVDIEPNGAFSMGSGSTLQSDTAGKGGDVYLVAASIDAAPTSLILAGPTGGPGADLVTIYAQGGNLKVGSVTGTDVYLRAEAAFSGGGGSTCADCGAPSGPGVSIGGNVTIGGAVSATGDFTALSDFADVYINAGVTALRGVTIRAHKNLTAAAGVTVIGDTEGAGGSKNAMALSAKGNVLLDATSALRGGASPKTPTTTVTVTSGGDLNTGKVSGTVVKLTAPGTVTVGGAVFGSQSVIIDPVDIILNADVTSGGNLKLIPDNSLTIGAGVTVSAAGSVDIETSDSITIGAGSTLQSDAAGKGGDLFLEAKTIDAAPTSLIVAGPKGGPGADAVTIYADSGALKVGSVIGTDIRLEAEGAFIPPACSGECGNGSIDPNGPGGDVTISGTVSAAGKFIALSDFADTHVNGNITASGAMTIKAAGNLTAAAGVTVIGDTGGTGAAMLLSAGGDVLLDAASALQGGASSKAPTAAVTVKSGGDLNTGKVSGTAVELTAPGTVTVAGAVFGSKSVNIDPTDIILNADVTSGGDLQLFPDNTVTIGAGVTVSAAGFVDIETSVSISIGAGSTLQSDAGGKGGDVFLEAATIDAAPTSLILAGPKGGPGADRVKIFADGGDLKVGSITGTDVYLEADGPFTGGCSGCSSTNLGGGLPSGGSIYIGGTVMALGDFTALSDFADTHIDANVTASGKVKIQAAGDLTALAGVAVIGDTSGGGTLMLLTAGGNVLLDATSALQNGATAAAPTGAVTVQAGGDLNTGKVAGTTVKLTAPGTVTVGGAVYGATSVTIDPTDIVLNANVTSKGGIDLTADNSITLAKGVNVVAGDHLNITATTISAGTGVLLQSDSNGDGAGDLDVEAKSITGGAALVAGADAVHPTAGVTAKASAGALGIGGVTGKVATLTATGDVTLGGPSYIGQSLTLKSSGGAVDLKGDLTSKGTVDLAANKALTFENGIQVKTAGYLHATAASISIGAGTLLQSDTDGNGDGEIHLETSGDMVATAGSSILGGTGAGTADVTLISDAGKLTVAAVGGAHITLNSAADLTLNGDINASGDISGGGDTIAINGNLTSGGAIGLGAKHAVTMTASRTVSAVHDVQIDAGSMTMAANDVIRADSAGTGAGRVLINLTGALNADATSALLGGVGAGASTGDILVSVGADAHFGQVSGRNVTLEADGDTVLAGTVHGANSVFVDPGNLQVLADVTSGGAITLQTGAGGALTIGPAVNVTSSGGPVWLVSDLDLTVGAGSTVKGVSLLARTNGVLHLASGATLATTGQTVAPTWPIVPYNITPGNEGPPIFKGLNIQAAGLDLQGSLTAGSAGARDDIFIQEIGAPTTVVVGGADASTGFHLSNAAIGRMTARNLIVMAGAGEGGGANANITVQDLALDSSRLSALALGTSSDKSIAVTGAVTLVGTGSVDLHLGFARTMITNGGPSNGALLGYIPGEIDITGSLGSASGLFNSTVLLARNDIFMGSDAFITAAKADPNFDAVKSSSLSAVDTGHVFVASHGLELGAQGRIIQQNTGQSPRFAGLIIDTPIAGHALTAAPALLSAKTIGTGSGAWTANYAAGPTRIDVFGLVRRANATTTNGVDAALEPNLADPAITIRDAYRINSCIFATHCVTAGIPRIELANEILNQDTINYVTLPPPSFTFTLEIEDPDDDDQNANGAPVTQSGNGDLWTGAPSSPTLR